MVAVREHVALWKVACRGAFPAPSSTLVGITATGHGGISALPPVPGASPAWPRRWHTWCLGLTMQVGNTGKKCAMALLPTDGEVCYWVGDAGLVVLSSVLKWHGAACYQGLLLQLKLANSESDKSCGRFNACWKVIFPTILEKKPIILQLFFSCLISTTEAIQHLQ